MTKRQRTLLFLAASTLFLFATPSIILYSQGYRIDWQTKKLVQTGGLYLKAVPARADVYLNNKFLKRTDFFFDSVLLGNLLPKTYEVHLEKQGYIPWAKTLQVQERQVTEAKHVILFPRQPNFQVIVQNVIKMWPSPNGREVVLQKLTPEQTSWTLTAWNPQSNEQRIFTERTLQEELLSLEWSEDSRRVLASLSKGESVRQEIWDLKGDAKELCVNTPCNLDFLGQTLIQPRFSLANPNEILGIRTGRTSQVLGAANYATQTFTPLVPNVVAFTTQEQILFYLRTDGLIWQKGVSSLQSPTALTSKPYSVQGETNYELRKEGKSVFVLEGNSTLLFGNDQQALQPLFPAVTNMALSPDKKKLALNNGSELWIFFVEDNSEQPFQKAGTSAFLTRFSTPVSQVSWLGDNYLFFATGDAVKVSEIDTRDSLNVATLGTFQDPKLYWHQESKTLYVLSEGVIFASEKLLP